MERKVAVIHTTVVTCDGINSRLKALVPDAEVMNIVDDSLLNDVKKEFDILSQEEMFGTDELYAWDDGLQPAI